MRRMSQFGRTRGLVAALEDSNIAPVAPAGDPALPDHANSLETDMLEVVDHAADIDAIVGEAQETAAVSEALEQIRDVLKVAAKEGGIDRHSAACVGIATQALYDRVGIRAQAMPALESFGGTSSRVSATRIAMESIGEQLKKIWEAIVNAFKKAIAWVVEFYQKVTGAATKMGARAEELKKRLVDLKGEAKEKELKNERLSKVLSTSKAAGDLAAADLLANMIHDFASGDTAKRQAEAVKAKVEKLNAGKDQGDNLTMAAYPSSEAYKDTGESAGKLKVFKSLELPGGKALMGHHAAAELSGDDAEAGLKEEKYFMGDFGKEEGEAKPLPVLTKETGEKVCDIVIKISKALGDAKKHADDMNAAKKSALDKAEQLGKAAGALGDDSADAKSFKKAQALAQNIARLADQPLASLSSFSITVAKTLNDYVEESIRAYSEEKKEAKPAEGAAAAPAAAAA